MRTASDRVTDAPDEKVAVVSFSSVEDCKQTFVATSSASIRGKAVCLFFDRKKGDKGKGARRSREGTSGVTRVVGFGAKGRGRGSKKKNEKKEV